MGYNAGDRDRPGDDTRPASDHQTPLGRECGLMADSSLARGKRRQTYWELLQHPLWQKKRLEVLEIHGFGCESCGAADQMLHVHHSYYEKGLAPWEYPTGSLHALCPNCHRKAQNRLLVLHRQIGRIDAQDVERLHGYALGLEALQFPNAVLDVYSYEVALGVADCWRVSVSAVIASLNDGVIDGYQLDAIRKQDRSAERAADNEVGALTSQES